LFGDILTDEAAMITGSIGMLPSASLGAAKLGMYEPIHGSAPDIAGTGKANPIAMILSCAMLLRYSLDLETEACAVETAVKNVLASGARTADIAAGGEYITTREISDLILKELNHQKNKG
ncbi:MAG: isocitrate/isopropylmalate family dehydrogenase, partial [Christensenella sp.]